MRFGLQSTFSVLVWCLCVGSVAMAQPGGGRGPGGFGFGGPGGFGPGGPGGGMGGNFLQLANNEVIRNELDITDEQFERIRELADKTQQGMREMFSGMRDIAPEEREQRMTEMREKMQERTEAAQKELDSILLPLQKKRLKQLTVQMRLMGGRATDALLSEEVTQSLGISDSQKQALTDLQKTVDEEMQKKMEEVRNQAVQKIIASLTPEQRAKWESLVGEKFDVGNAMRQGFRFGGGGGPGGGGGGQRRRPAQQQ